MDERLKEWLDNHDGDDYCNYCTYQKKCHGMTWYSEPYCCSHEREEYLDLDSILYDIENDQLED